MKKVLSLFKVLFIPLCIASLIGLGGAVVVDDAVAGTRSAKQSASKNGSKKKKPKTRCNKRRGEKTYLIRGRCRPLRSLQEVAPTPGDVDLPDESVGEVSEPVKPEEPVGEVSEPGDVGEFRGCPKIYRPEHIITTEGCYTFGNDCEAYYALKHELKGKEILSRGRLTCEGTFK